MGRSSRPDRPWRRAAFAAAFAGALGGCREIATVVDVAFPSTVPGLPSDQAWMSLPLRRWLTESDIEPVAISACPAPNCSEEAVVGLFVVRGTTAARARRGALDPISLVRPRRKRDRRLLRSRVSTVQLDEGGVPGTLVRMSGKGAAAGYVATLPSGDATRIVVIVSRTEETTRMLARSVIVRLRGG